MQAEACSRWECGSAALRIGRPGPRHLVGAIARADERTAGDLGEAQGPGHPAQLVELLRGQVARDGQVPGRGLQVLAEREEVAADGAEVGERLEDLLGRLAQAE